MLVSTYRTILSFQYLFLFIDLFLNSFSNLLVMQNVIVLLILYVIQDVIILCAVIIIILLSFSTYIFQAGLVGMIIDKFKMPIIVIFCYFGLCVGLHVWEITERWDDVNNDVWSPGFRALYVVQRLGAVMYYYSYKRTALRLADPRFYQNSEWIHKEFEKRR